MSHEHILQFFEFSHLPAALKDVSRPFCELAVRVVETLPRNPERTVALRKLLEAKDAAVRAVIAKEAPQVGPAPVAAPSPPLPTFVLRGPTTAAAPAVDPASLPYVASAPRDIRPIEGAP